MRAAPLSSAASSVRVVADAARQLDLHAPDLLDDATQDARVAAAAERRVEVDEVDPLGTLAREVERGVDGVAVVRLGARLALREAHRPAARDIDSGQQDQLGH